MFRKVRIVGIAVVLGATTIVGVVSPVSAANSAGGKCTKVGQVVSNAKKNGNLKCTQKGKSLIWVAVSSSSSGSASGGSSSGGSGSSSSWQFFGSCTGTGKFQYLRSAVSTCRNGKVGYALPEDFPTVPVGGYTTRPDWYPTITQIFGGSAEPACKASSIRFTKPVIPLDKLAPSIPYGMMVGEHVTPIDHAYLGLTTLSIPQASRTSSDFVNVTAPADGTIIELSSLGSPTSNRVVIDHGCGLYSVYMVLNKGSGVLADTFSQLNGGNKQLKIPIKAGEVFGQQRDNPLDFNVFDGAQWLSGFANYSSYLTQDTSKPYTADYLPFFTTDIKTAMEAVLQRTTSPRIGKIDHDKVGTAAGNWFLKGTFGYSGIQSSTYLNATSEVNSGSVSGKNTYAWSHLAIAPHWVDTSKWILSIGWKDNVGGDATQMMLVARAGKPSPDALTAASGEVVYDLYSFSSTPAKASLNEPDPVGYTIAGGSSMGQVILQINSDSTLSLEFGTSFTANKRTYVR